MIKKIAFVFAACAVMSSQQAAGSLLIFVDDISSGGGIEVIVEDGLGAGVLSSYSGLLTTHADTNATVGIVAFSGAAGANITFASVTGFGIPVIGPNIIDTLAASITSAAGVYRIATAQTGFTGLFGSYVVNNEIGGTSTAGASLTTMYGADLTNTMFAGPSGSVGPLTGSPFSGFGSFSTGLGPGPFSISQWVTISHSTSGITTFDMSTQVVVPEPGTIAIWSVFAGLGLIGGFRRKTR